MIERPDDAPRRCRPTDLRGGPRRRARHRGPARRSPAPAPPPTGPAGSARSTPCSTPTGLTGVITHNPGDMTVSVRAGTPLRDAARRAAPSTASTSRSTPPGSPTARRSAASSPPPTPGPGALVYGSLRDLVIGATLVLADGTVARSGGHVIKNVAGYDLAKLVHGSYGTLAVIAEVVLRLHPRAAGDRDARAAAARSPRPRARRRDVLGGPFEPAALEWVSAARRAGPAAPGDEARLLVRVERRTAAALPARGGADSRELLGAPRRPKWPRPAGERGGAVACGTPQLVRGGRRRRRAAGRGDRPLDGCPTLLGSRCRRSRRSPPGSAPASHRRAAADPARSPRRTRPCTPRAARRVLRARPAGFDRPALGPAAVRARRAPGRQDRARPRRPASGRAGSPLDVT